jgi:hypothetical protein
MAIVKKFRATLATVGPGTSFVELPFDPKEIFGKARPPVVVTVRGHSWRSTPAIYDGRAYLPVRKSNRDAAAISVGDRVEVTVALDTEPRVVEPPPEIRKHKAASAAWSKQSFTHQREHADWIDQAKAPETRARRVEKAIAMLLAKYAK